MTDLQAAVASLPDESLGRELVSTGFVMSGDPKYGPCTLECKIPVGHPLNKWGRDMTVEVRCREMNRDMYRGMGDASVDVVHYGGHSNFGNNTLQSLQGTVRSVNLSNGWFTMDVGNNNTLTVSMPYRASNTDMNKFQSLRVGDFVRLYGSFLNANRVELQRFY